MFLGIFQHNLSKVVVFKRWRFEREPIVGANWKVMGRVCVFMYWGTKLCYIPEKKNVVG